MNVIIVETDLAAHLGLHYTTLRRWGEKGLMPPSCQEASGLSEPVYVCSEVDTWLAGLCHNMPPKLTPTIKRLVKKRERLLRTAQVIKQLAHKGTDVPWRLDDRRNAGKWPHLILPAQGGYRYLASHIAYQARPEPPQKTCSIREVQHIFGVGVMLVRGYVQTGKLIVPEPDRKPMKILKISVVRLLRECLPSGGTYLWLQARKRTSLPLISGNMFTRMSKMPESTIRRYLELQKIPNLMLPGSRERRIPFEALATIDQLF